MICFQELKKVEFQFDILEMIGLKCNKKDGYFCFCYWIFFFLGNDISTLKIVIFTLT
jgi:hypothetical protein